MSKTVKEHRDFRRSNLRLLGFCACGGTPEIGYKTCKTCLNRSEQRRIRCKLLGLCGCGHRILDAGKKCANCLNNANVRVAIFKITGLCYCGKRLPKKGYEQCQFCLDKKNEKNAQLKACGKCQCGRSAVSGFELCPICRERATKTAKERLKTDKEFAISTRLRDSVYSAIKKKSRKFEKSGRTEFVMGCSFAFARKHIESLFLPGMSWANMGLWHIDHHIPRSAFNLKESRQQRLCSNWRNLRPLWATDNLRKKDKLPADYLERLAELEVNVL